jgi:Uncharacterised nucleotidyltransferase
VVRTELRAEEAVLLAHALVCRLAEQVGTRVLFIKGRTAVALGARPDRPSQDVDVLVDPAGFDRLCEAIRAAGWQQRVSSDSGLRHVDDVAFDHSTHFIHDEWPCDLDVHFNFPGFLNPADQVFAALWDHHATVEVAGSVVTTPDLPGAALVVALHALRDPAKPYAPIDLGFLADSLPNTLGEAGLRRLSELCVATGSEVTARPFLERVGAPLRELTAESRTRAQAWAFRQDVGARSGVVWLTELARTPWRERPALLRRALFPPRELLLSSYLAARATRRELAVLHAKRWARGIRSLPSAAKWARRRPK